MAELTFIEITKIIKWQIVSRWCALPKLDQLNTTQLSKNQVTQTQSLYHLRYDTLVPVPLSRMVTTITWFRPRCTCLFSFHKTTRSSQAVDCCVMSVCVLRLMVAWGNEQMTLIKLIMKIETCRFHLIPHEDKVLSVPSDFLWISTLTDERIHFGHNLSTWAQLNRFWRESSLIWNSTNFAPQPKTYQSNDLSNITTHDKVYNVVSSKVPAEKFTTSKLWSYIN